MTTTDYLIDILRLVAEFLLPRELYNLAHASKEIGQNFPMSSVVQVAMCNGNTNQRTPIEHMYELTSSGSIYSHSPGRLLQIVNYISCEVCHIKKVNYVCSGLGICCCMSCLRVHTQTITIDQRLHCRQNHYELEEVLKMQRVAARGSGQVLYAKFPWL